MKPKFKTTTMTTTFTLAHLPKRHCICRRLATCHTHHKTQAVVVAVEALKGAYRSPAKRVRVLGGYDSAVHSSLFLVFRLSLP